jgi:hypothetical protein
VLQQRGDRVAVVGAAVHEHVVGVQRQDVGREVLLGGRQVGAEHVEVRGQTPLQLRAELLARGVVVQQRVGGADRVGLLQHLVREVDGVVRQQPLGVRPADEDPRADRRRARGGQRVADLGVGEARVEDRDDEDRVGAVAGDRVGHRQDLDAVDRRRAGLGPAVGEADRLDAVGAQRGEHRAPDAARAVQDDRPVAGDGRERL